MLVEICRDLSINPVEVESVGVIYDQQLLAKGYNTLIYMKSGRTWKVTVTYDQVTEVLAVAKLPKEFNEQEEENEN